MFISFSANLLICLLKITLKIILKVIFEKELCYFDQLNPSYVNIIKKKNVLNYLKAVD